ncbi:murein transglycosylase [Pyrenophora seminiperda CCB06]|uniref:AA9 family lytic polysaccharide monooxygenase n=1 Tax=Pyrenophora seminiperda CCB06 TaxID=1302712 RepID=A0A3M7LY13_9PLEO|nr:murein transglycosylase [Pyrenophora seminiperda CCB06]
MPSKIQAAALFGALAASVSAHGHLAAIKVAGEGFTAYDPSFQYQKPAPEVIEWSCPECLDNGFVSPDMYTDATKIACHKDATAGAKVAKVAAGGKLDISWTTWPESHVGPVIDYMAKVSDATAAKSSDLEFFKIAAAGFSDGKWAASKLIANNNTWSVTIPSTLAAGQYVLRHEIIALHAAGDVGGAQNYPKCINVEVTGSGTATPKGTPANKLYTPTDPGIKVNVYGDNSKYQIPGPALFSGAGGSDAGSGSGSETPSNTTAPATSTSAAAVAVSASPVASSPVASPTSAPSGNTGSPSTLPKEFTLDTFISWLEEKAGSKSSQKVRRHPRAFRN